MQMQKINPADANAIFAGLQEEYATRRAEAESEVVHWGWYTAPFFDLRPLWFQRHYDLPGSPMRKRPAHLNGRVEVGVDARSRIAVERLYNEYGFYETFFRWAHDHVEAAHYDYYVPDRRPINVLLLNYLDSRPISADLIGERGWVREEYEWQNDELVGVQVFHTERVGRHYSDLRPHSTIRPVYSDRELDSIHVQWPPDPPRRPGPVVEVVYKRLSGPAKL
jgi:hypothetical protein